MSIRSHKFLVYLYFIVAGLHDGSIMYHDRRHLQKPKLDSILKPYIQITCAQLKIYIQYSILVYCLGFLYFLVVYNSSIMYQCITEQEFEICVTRNPILCLHLIFNTFSTQFNFFQQCSYV